MPLDRLISIARPGTDNLFRYAPDGGSEASIPASVTLKTAAAAGDTLIHLQAVPRDNDAVPPVIGEALAGDVVQFGGQQYDLTSRRVSDGPFAVRFGRVPWNAAAIPASIPTFRVGFYGTRAASVLESGRTWTAPGRLDIGNLSPEEMREFLNFSSDWWTGVRVDLPQGPRLLQFRDPIIGPPFYDRVEPFESLTVGDSMFVVAELVSGQFRQGNGIFDDLELGNEDFPANTTFHGGLQFVVPPGDTSSSVTQEAVGILRTPVTEPAPVGSMVTFVSSRNAPKIWSQLQDFRTTQDVTLDADNQAIEIDEQVSEWRISSRQAIEISTANVMIDDGGRVWDIRGVTVENDPRFARIFCQRQL